MVDFLAGVVSGVLSGVRESRLRRIARSRRAELERQLDTTGSTRVAASVRLGEWYRGDALTLRREGATVLVDGADVDLRAAGSIGDRPDDHERDWTAEYLTRGGERARLVVHDRLGPLVYDYVSPAATARRADGRQRKQRL